MVLLDLPAVAISRLLLVMWLQTTSSTAAVLGQGRLKATRELEFYIDAQYLVPSLLHLQYKDNFAV